MMKWLNDTKLSYILFIGVIILLVSGCNINKKPSIGKGEAKNKTRFITINDSTWSERIYDSNNVTMELVNSSFHYDLKISKNGKTNIINFDKENIPAKTPELEWSNNEFASIVTWWSAGFSRSLFIDLNDIGKFIFIDKDMLLSDKNSNNILYVDTIYDNSTILMLENLVSRKQKTITLPVDDQSYIDPFYDDIKFERNHLIIATSDKKIKLKILE